MESLKEFWQVVVEVWRQGVLGVDIGRLLIALGIFLAFLVLRRLFTRVILGRFKSLAARSRTHIDDRVINSLEKPVRLIPLVMGLFFATEYLDLTGLAQVAAGNTIRSLIVVIIFWGLVNMVEPFSFLLERLEKVFTQSLVEWLVKAVKAGLIFIGAATVLEIWGIQVGPIIAGLGLFGIAVALGAQDMFKNLISGILILAEKRFRQGDWIRVDGVVEGTVESIGFRSTRVRRFDKAPVHVPNAKLSDNAVTNFSAMTHRRIYWTIGVEYRTTVDQLRRIRDGIEEYILSSDDFASPDEVPTFVRIDEFSDSSIDILVYCFTRTTVWGEWLTVKEALAYKIKEIVLGAGTAFAFPSQSVYVETLPDERAEVFEPPSSK